VDRLDVEWFRARHDRALVVHRVVRPALILGSTQPAEVVRFDEVKRSGIEVVRRRAGGGAVWCDMVNSIWVDAWIPSSDPLWQRDVERATDWVGLWWTDALGRLGIEGLEAQMHCASTTSFSRLVCFAGVGPGELVHGDHKVTGLAQWRGREGALMHCLVYLAWDPKPLVRLLSTPEPHEASLDVALADCAVGLRDLTERELDSTAVITALVNSLPQPPSWSIHYQ
jgi:lipoate---protein ligase